MCSILKSIISIDSIYERTKFYKSIIDKKFNVVKKVPILYKVHGDFKDSLLELFDRHDMENESLRGDFGIMYVFINELDLISKINEEMGANVHFEFSHPIKFSDVNSNFSSCVSELQASQELLGEGVTIAFLDTGIDYTLDAFRNEDGSTRIKYIYNVNRGKVYNEEEINSVLVDGNSSELSDELDFNGHGTAVASVACAGGNINRNLYGVASRSSIISVNTVTDIDSTETLFHTVMKGFEFLLDKQKEDGLLLVVNLSFNTNYGAHTGRSIFEEYVSFFSSNSNISVVVSAGNEGAAGHHKSGRITNEGEEVNVQVSGNHTLLPIFLYKGILTDVFLKIDSPMTSVGVSLKVIEGTQNFRIGDNSVNVVFTGPNNYNPQGDIIIILDGDRNEHVERGVWTINISASNDYESDYNMWLPISEDIGYETRFLKPDNNNTIGSPATVFNVISVGSYNYRTETVSVFSGRGEFNNPYNVKPDLLAAGEEIRAIYPGGRISGVSGTSFSAPIVSGICAIFMEWGIVKGNKPNLYGEVLKYFLVRGATRLNDIIYPNNSYGYGFACAFRAFSDLRNNIGNVLSLSDNRNSHNHNSVRDTFNIFNDSNLQINVCPLDAFYDKNRVIFLGTINPNIENILEEVCVYPLESETDSEIISIISVPLDKLDLFESIYLSSENISIQRSFYYGLCSEGVSPIADAGIYQLQNNIYLNLTGRDVIAGIVDTGIDYLNKEFINEIGESRILEIWDQTIRGDSGGDVLFGSVYTKDQITSAIKLSENGGDPYSIVPSRDTFGHGTAMAGITSARGYGNIKGGAPSSDLVIVKLRDISVNFREYLNFNIDENPIYDEVTIYLALRYLRRIQSKYDKPMVVLLPLQSNGGYHCGSTIIEQQITKYSENPGFVVVVPSGNQANKEIHAGGVIEGVGNEKIIELFVDKGQTRLRVDIYLRNFANGSLVVVSPSGERTGRFNLDFKAYGEFKFLFEETEMRLLGTILANSIYIGQNIELLFENLKTGIWQIIIIAGSDKKLKYDAYLSLREFLKPQTRFLNSVSDNTVTSPATARLAVSMAYLNQNSTTIVSESGQGYTLDGRVSPLLAAGGINVLTTGKNQTEYLISGSSVSAAVAVGGIALLLEWAIVRQNRVRLDATFVIWLLISAATVQKGYEFPNKYWGYGILNVRNVFELLR